MRKKCQNLFHHMARANSPEKHTAPLFMVSLAWKWLCYAFPTFIARICIKSDIGGTSCNIWGWQPERCSGRSVPDSKWQGDHGQ